MLALAAVMGALYDRLQPTDGSTRNEWYLAGLMHDGDYTDSVPHDQQGIQITKWVREAGFEIPDNMAHAMAAHNWHNTGVEPKNLMDWSIFCADSLTGLIVACTLVQPTRHISDLNLQSILKKFPNKSFASGTRRDEIALCDEKLGLKLEEFIQISLTAMQQISHEIGL
jgi:predicted hydrolase (HD superfamily)